MAFQYSYFQLCFFQYICPASKKIFQKVVSLGRPVFVYWYHVILFSAFIRVKEFSYVYTKRYRALKKTSNHERAGERNRKKKKGPRFRTHYLTNVVSIHYRFPLEQPRSMAVSYRSEANNIPITPSPGSSYVSERMRLIIRAKLPLADFTSRSHSSNSYVPPLTKRVY